MIIVLVRIEPSGAAVFAATRSTELSDAQAAAAASHVVRSVGEAAD